MAEYYGTYRKKIEMPQGFEVPPRDPSDTEKGLSKSNWIIILGLAFFLLGGLIMFLLVNDEGEDTREVRQYGGLTCIYNVSDDEIEECG